MCRKLILSTCFVLAVCLVNSVSALELAVDFVYPEVTSPAKHDLTHDSGFTAFVTSPTNWGHDLWAHDPRTMTDIDGSGISVRLACGYEGDTSMKVLGMKPVGDNQTATGTPSGDPIANSWVISHRHWGNNPIDVEGRLSWGSVYLRFYGPGLVPGRYRLRSYHNAPPNPADPDWDITEGNDVMPSISVWGPEVTPLVELSDVQIQHVQSDAELVPVDIEFELCGVYDGTGENTVTIRFESPPGGDRQQGGAAVLNAFILYVASGGMASCPDPADGAENVCPGVELTWNPGSHPAYHDVYLGTSLDDVNEASTSDTRGVYMSRLPGEDTNYAPVGLELGQTYYWRIDEVNDACSPYLWKGTVWSLTTNDGTAFNPNPQDGSVFIPLDANLSWTPGCLAMWNDVYFGTSFNDVNDANSSLPAGTSVYKGRYAADANEYDDPASLAKGTLYYWRIDSIGDTNSWKGQVWSFRTIVDPDIVVYYKFEETIGNTVADYSGLDYLGWVRDSSPETWEPNDGYDGGCIYFTGDESLIVPREALTLVDKAISFSMWVNNVRGGGDMPVLDAGDDGTAGALKLTALVPSEAGDVSWRAGDDSDDVLVWPAVKPADLIGDWHLFVFVKDEDEEPTGKMSIYFDGSLAESKSDVNTASLANVSRNTGGRMFRLGSFNDEDGQYEGRLDDFRMYKRALSASDVAELFRGEDLGLAWSPIPYDGERDVAVDVNL
ncbi:MAG: LamG-like jellyroll fold domain-containing protein, partial [Planctomycetota bacterium]